MSCPTPDGVAWRPARTAHRSRPVAHLAGLGVGAVIAPKLPTTGASLAQRTVHHRLHFGTANIIVNRREIMAGTDEDNPGHGQDPRAEGTRRSTVTRSSRRSAHGHGQWHGQGHGQHTAKTEVRDPEKGLSPGLTWSGRRASNSRPAPWQKNEWIAAHDRNRSVSLHSRSSRQRLAVDCAPRCVGKMLANTSRRCATSTT